MPINAWKNGLTTINEANMNAPLAMQEFVLIYEGVQRDAKAGEGVVENSIANYSHCAQFTLTDSTEISRVELELDRDGDGADLVVQIRTGMDPATGVEGTVLKEVVVPKEFIPVAAAYWSVPIGLAELTEDGTYWLVVLQAGDLVNKLDWIGEAAPDASYPAYYLNQGTWEANNALHFKVFSGNSGDLIHGIYGTNMVETYIYAGEDLSYLYRYCPPSDGPAGGIRDIISLVYDGDYMTKGEAV